MMIKKLEKEKENLNEAHERHLNQAKTSSLALRTKLEHSERALVESRSTLEGRIKEIETAYAMERSQAEVEILRLSDLTLTLTLTLIGGGDIEA